MPSQYTQSRYAESDLITQKELYYPEGVVY